MADTDLPIPPDVNRGSEILGICGALVAIALVMVVLRVWVRTRIIGKLGWDDWTMVAAMVVMFAEMMVIIPQVQLGAGRHVQYIQPPENVAKGLHLNFVTQPLCLIGLCLTKVSVGLFLLRLTTSKGFKRFIIGMIIFTILSATGNFLTVFFQCRPLAFTWGGVPEGKCIPPGNLKFAAFFNSSVAVLTDIIFALLPVPILWNVQMNWRVKSAVAIILSVGVFAAVAAIVKITFLSNYGKHGDFLFDSSDLTIWTTVEICTAIIAACFPSLKPLFKTLFDGSSVRNQQYYGASSSRYKGYVRNEDRTATHKSKSAPCTRPGDDDEYEMYDKAQFTSDIKGGISTTGSEESILSPVEGDRCDGGITKTTDVVVSSARV
ncbi:hypothetical protein QBC35DRAFT_510369 [Podospora australis]|uniref:Rhodopsin domain-containing protein n=1 Tax=Podospora australis TaxID=1536484 RepID=A0AAN6WHL6_9PEZI|nr:hypothetical protein QBC35DRAFT_510369 [Podospora australis]